VRLLGLYAAQPKPRGAGNDEMRLAVMLHGWEGSADSSYVLSAAALLYSHGFDVMRLNLRDHGGTHALNQGLFHSCRLPEIVGAIGALCERFPQARLYLGGFSLGGNFMLRAGADAGLPERIAGVVAVSPVLDPESTLRALEQGAVVYRRYFVRRWTRSLRAKQRAWPGVHDFDDLARSGDLRQMTADLVPRCTDFGSLAAYLEGYAVTGDRLAHLRVPSRILLAADDPIIPAQDVRRLAASAQLQILRTSHGGHCGFMAHWAGPSYADRYLLEQFSQFDAAPGAAAPRSG
jgi:predicted alpha/beta-fold hydrolase